MKFLTLIRHAKSSRDTPVSDELRPLNARGLQNAPAMGKYLDATFRFAPDVLISSPATRAIHTARLIAQGIGFNEWQIKEDKRIYEAPVPALIAVIRDQPDEFGHVCLVGHNPGMESLTNELCGTRAVVDVVTCAVIMLELDIPSWKATGEGTARLREYIYPALIGLGQEGD
ncbi:MAG TPA: histidine phosphatase family protein [Verrucomicrobiales bacterium]|jgi:phosphohistidine phosphatase|nr:histidine phosphatase family protein [Verrucomicrobiales bacterium]